VGWVRPRLGSIAASIEMFHHNDERCRLRPGAGGLFSFSSLNYGICVQFIECLELPK
jgi:hypothetical protein